MSVRWWTNYHLPEKSDAWYKSHNATRAINARWFLEDIFGIVNLDRSAAVTDEKNGREIGSYSLRTILPKHLCLSDGHQLIAEIHQAKEPMAPVQAGIPNTSKAERMIAMMNKNFPSYVGNVLKDQGLPDDFLMELFHRTCCQIICLQRLHKHLGIPRPAPWPWWKNWHRKGRLQIWWMVWCTPMWVRNSYFVTKLRFFLVTDNEFRTQDLRSQTITNTIVKPLDHMLSLLLTPPNKLYTHLNLSPSLLLYPYWKQGP